MTDFNGLNITWLFMAVIFFYFAILFWIYSRSGLRPFIFGGAQKPGDQGSESVLSAVPEDLQKEVESFRRSINLTIQTRFRIGAIGMVIAGGLAVASMFIA